MLFWKDSKKIHRLTRRCVLLLEVLIAFALVALCAIPLIYPHVAILRSEREFISTVELDHVVNLLYANRLQKLYQNEISWSEIEDQKERPVDETLLNQIDYKKTLPFKGTYRFVYEKQRPSKPVDKVVYLYQLEFKFTPDQNNKGGNPGKVLTYNYQVVLERKYHATH